MVKWVRKKIHFGGMIENPVTFSQSTRFSEMQEYIASRKYTFTSFPILDEESHFVGLMTRDEMEFAEQRNPPLGGVCVFVRMCVCVFDYV